MLRYVIVLSLLAPVSVFAQGGVNDHPYAPPNTIVVPQPTPVTPPNATPNKTTDYFTPPNPPVDLTNRNSCCAVIRRDRNR